MIFSFLLSPSEFCRLNYVIAFLEGNFVYMFLLEGTYFLLFGELNIIFVLLESITSFIV